MLPLLRDDFEINFDRAITIIVGENGVGKSTLLKGIAALASYDQAGGGRDTCQSIIPTRSMFQAPLRASCLPKITNGWFRADRFSRSRDIWTKPPSMIRSGRHRPTSCRIRILRGSSEVR